MIIIIIIIIYFINSSSHSIMIMLNYAYTYRLLLQTRLAARRASKSILYTLLSILDTRSTLYSIMYILYSLLSTLYSLLSTLRYYTISSSRPSLAGGVAEGVAIVQYHVRVAVAGVVVIKTFFWTTIVTVVGLLVTDFGPGCYDHLNYNHLSAVHNRKLGVTMLYC